MSLDLYASQCSYSAPVLPPLRLTRGERFADRYELIELIGRGGSGQVWRAHDPVLEREVAVKVARPRDVKARSRLVREAKIGGRLRHPTLMPVLDFGDRGECVYIIMPLVLGPTLRARIAGGRLPWRTVAVWMHHLLVALGILHANGYIHRDVKSDNCLISTDPTGDRLILADFGLAREAVSRGSSEIIGSVNYMAPERFVSKNTDARSDIFSAGVVLFEALTRRLPYPARDHLEALEMHAQIPTPRISDIVAVPKLFDVIISRALAKDPRDRYQSAAEFDEQILTLLDTRELETVPLAGAWEVLQTLEAWENSHLDRARVSAIQAASCDRRWGSLETLLDVARIAEDPSSE